MHLKRVVFWRNLDCKVFVENRNPFHDVVAHLGDLGEEEEGEEAGNAAETSGKHTAAICQTICASETVR